MEPLAAGDPKQVGPYRLRARLGSGGMGQVFLGYSPAGRAVAVKVIHRELATDPAFRTRFRREVAAARAVSGAYTAPVTEAGPDDDPPWLATVFVPGPSLADAVAEAGPLPAASVWKLAAGLVEALQAVHACSLVHRDLKPANVLMAIDGPRLIDFGISRALEGTRMTSTGLIVGTPSFMSPEQADGARVGPASDVFSLGCVIVFAATGAGPFGEGSPASMLYRVVHGSPVLDELSGGLRELAAACLAKAPADRPSLAELEDAIAAGRAPEERSGPTSFWPVAVTGLIRTFQARLSTEIPDPPQPVSSATQQVGSPTRPAGTVARPAGTVAQSASTAEPASGTGTLTAATAALPGTARIESPEGTRPITAQPIQVADGAAGTINGMRAVSAAAGQPAPPDAAVGGAGGQRAVPGLPGDLADWAGPGGQPATGLTRRRALFTLAGVSTAAGLAVAGWELSRGGAAHHVASGRRPAAGRKAATPAARTSPSPSPGAQRGGRIWSYTTGGYVQSGIAVADGAVYVGSNDGKVYALRASDGHRIWDLLTGGPVDSGIAVAGGAVYAGSYDEHVYALRVSNGRKIWKSPLGGIMSSGIAVADGTVYGGCIGLSAFALRASDGGKIWSIGPGDSMQGIAVAADVLYAGSTGSNVYARHTSNGGQIWESPTNGPVASGIALAQGAVYAGSYDDHVYGLGASDGRKLWAFPAGSQVNSGIAVAGGVLCAGTYNGIVYGLRASDGHKLWAFPTGGNVDSGIAMAGGTVYFGSWDNKVYALRASDGRKIWDFPAGGSVSSGITVADGVVYVGSDDNNVYALRA